MPPNDDPTVVVLEIDGDSVSSPQDLNIFADPREDIDIRVRGLDEDGNLSYVALIEADGDILVSKNCDESRGSRCTVILGIKSDSQVGEIKTFFAVAEDSNGRRSAGIQMSIETERAAIGGGGGGGGGGGNSPPNTPVPTSTPTASPTPAPGLTCDNEGDALPAFGTPTLAMESGQGPVGQSICLDLYLSEAPNGLSGYHVKVTIGEPATAQIVDFEYNPLFALGRKTGPGTPTPTPTSTVELFAVDIGRNIGVGDTDIWLATVELSLLEAGDTQVTLVLGAFGVQEELGALMTVVEVDGALTVN